MWKTEHRVAADHRGLRYPSDLGADRTTHPARQRGGRKRAVDVREILNAIFYVLATLSVAGVAQGSAAQEHSAFQLHK
jgi:hypothetical protein